MLKALPSGELLAGEGIETKIRRVRIGDGHVMLARLDDGRVVAFAPSCPHQATDLDDATIWDGIMRCPRHSYQYDTQSGQNIHPSRDAQPENMWKLRPGYLPCFEVARGDDGWIWVAAEAQPPPLCVRPGTGGRRNQRRRRAGGRAPVSTAVTDQSMKFLTVTAGSTFDLRLPTTPRPGYAWRFEVTGDLLTLVDEQFEPGAMPCHCVRVAAAGPGAATLTCTYAGPEDHQRAEVRIYVVRVAQS